MNNARVDETHIHREKRKEEKKKRGEESDDGMRMVRCAEQIWVPPQSMRKAASTLLLRFIRPRLFFVDFLLASRRASNNDGENRENRLRPFQMVRERERRKKKRNKGEKKKNEKKRKETRKRK